MEEPKLKIVDKDHIRKGGINLKYIDDIVEDIKYATNYSWVAFIRAKIEVKEYTLKKRMCESGVVKENTTEYWEIKALQELLDEKGYIRDEELQ